MGQNQASWVAAFMAATSITSIADLDVERHYNKLNSVLVDQSPELMELIGETIGSARGNGGKHESQIPSNIDLEVILGEEGKSLIQRLYQHYGVEVTFSDRKVIAKIPKKEQAA